MLLEHDPEEGSVKSDEEIMEILEAYDLTGSSRAAAELAGVRTTPLPPSWRRVRTAG